MAFLEKWEYWTTSLGNRCFNDQGWRLVMLKCTWLVI